MTALTFALPQESSGIRSAMRKCRKSAAGPYVLGEIASRPVLLAHTGMGLAAAEHTTAALLRAHSPRLVVSAGFAGALDSGLAVGDLVVATNHSAPDLVELALPIAGARTFFGSLTTHPSTVETAQEKAALSQIAGGLAVDMETAVIAELCKQAGVPLLSVRAISDSARQALPVPLDDWFDLGEQRPRPGRLCAFLGRNPGRVIPFVRFIAGLPRSRSALTTFLLRLLPLLPE